MYADIIFQRKHLRNDIPKEIFDLIIEKYKKYDKRSTERLMAYAKAMRISRQVEQIGLE